MFLPNSSCQLSDVYCQMSMVNCYNVHLSRPLVDRIDADFGPVAVPPRVEIAAHAGNVPIHGKSLREGRELPDIYLFPILPIIEYERALVTPVRIRVRHEPLAIGREHRMAVFGQNPRGNALHLPRLVVEQQ